MRGVGSLELLLWLWVHDSLVSLPLAARGRAHKQKSLDLLDLRPNPMRRGHHKRKRLKWMVDGPVASPLFSSVSDRAGPTHTFSLLPPPLLSPPLLSLSLALPRFSSCVSDCIPRIPQSRARPGHDRAASTRLALVPSPAPSVATSIPRSQAPKLPSSEGPRAPIRVLPPYCQLPGSGLSPCPPSLSNLVVLPASGTGCAFQ